MTLIFSVKCGWQERGCIMGNDWNEDRKFVLEALQDLKASNKDLTHKVDSMVSVLAEVANNYAASDIKELKDKLSCHDREIGILSTKLNLFSVLVGAGSAVVSGIATWLKLR